MVCKDGASTVRDSRGMKTARHRRQARARLATLHPTDLSVLRDRNTGRPCGMWHVRCNTPPGAVRIVSGQTNFAAPLWVGM